MYQILCEIRSTLDSNLKDYFTIEERTKVKIKNTVRYSAISSLLQLFFIVLKR